MVDVQKTVEVLFYGTDKVGSTINSIGGSLDKLGDQVGTVAAPFANLAEDVLKLEAALAALAVGGLAVAVNEAGRFSDSFQEIATLIDASDANLNKFSSDILDYSRTSTAAIEDINQSVYTAISAGIDYTESLDLLNQAEKLSTSGKADLASSTAVLASIMNAYGYETSEAARVSDVLFKTVKQGQTTLPELAGSLSDVTSIAASLEVPIETITAAIAALTAAGVPTSQAITQIRGALIALTKPSSDAAKTAGELGINFSASAVAAKGFEVVLKEAFEAAGGNVEILGRLFGRVEGLNAALVLGADQNGKFAESLDEMRNSAGATEEAFGKMANNLDQLSQTLKNNLQATLIDIGRPLLDESKDIIEAMTNIFQAASFSLNQGAFDDVYELIERLASDLAEGLNLIAEQLPEAFDSIEWEDLIKSIEALKDAVFELFNTFFDDIDLTEPEGLAAVIQKIVDSVTALTNVSAGILQSFTPVVEAISALVDRLVETDAATQENIGSFLGLAKVVETLSGLVSGLGSGLQTIGTALTLLATSSLIKSTTGFLNLGGSVGAAAAAMGKFIAVVGLPVAAYKLTDWLFETIPLLDEFRIGLANFLLSYRGLDEESIKAAEAQAQHTKAIGDAAVAMVKAAEAADKLPSEKTTEIGIEGAADFEAQVQALTEEIKALPDESETVFTAAADRESIQVARNEIETTVSEDLITIVRVGPDPASLAQTVDTIEKQLPTERYLELQLQGEIDVQLAQIRAQAETVQAAMEWEARLDIAEVEAATERLTTYSDNISAMFQNTGDVILGAIGALPDLSASEYLTVMRLIDEENKRRNKLLEAQLELFELMRERQDFLETGEALIRIEAAGLEPSLQLIFREILRQTQIWATAEGQQFLLGL